MDDGLEPRRTPLELRIDARAVTKARHRHAGDGAHTYTPERTAAFARLVRDEGRVAMRGTGVIQGPVRVSLVAEIEPPSSWSSVRRERAIAGEIAPTVKPDFDNLQKNVFDALNGVVYRDDAQIVSSTVDKVYARKSRVYVRVEPLDAEPAYRR